MSPTQPHQSHFAAIQAAQRAHYQQPHRTTTSILLAGRQVEVAEETAYTAEELANPEVVRELVPCSPSLRVIQQILARPVSLDSLHWRDLEELVAELLEKDGYMVELGPGTKDGGKDIFVIKDLGSSGLFAAVWQVKHSKRGKRVGEGVIRELADTRGQHNASKGIIATNTYLTKGALARVERQRYILGKVERPDLLEWMEKVVREHRR